MSAHPEHDEAESIGRNAEPPVAFLHGREISVQFVRDLYDRSRIAIPFFLILLFVIRWAIDPAYIADASVRTVFFLLAAINLVRWGAAMLPPHRRDAAMSPRAQLALFAGGVTLSSSLLATIVMLTWPLLDTSRIAILAVITSGLLSGAVTSLGFSPFVYMLFLLPPVGALFIMAMKDARPDWGADILATSFALYAISMITISIDQYRMRKRSIELRLRLSDLVVRDALTNLYNRRFLHEFMTVEAARIARDMTDVERGRQPEHNAAIGVYVVDLDFFKRINDTHGHGAGDEMLKQAAVTLSKALRNSDVIVRWGGEEFVAVARIKQRQDSGIVAEKLRKAIESMEISLPGGMAMRTSCSVGFCVIPFFPEQPRLLSWEQVLTIADAALYLAKDEGRNRWIGVICGGTAWKDVQRTYREVIADVRQAAARDLVKIERREA